MAGDRRQRGSAESLGGRGAARRRVLLRLVASRTTIGPSGQAASGTSEASDAVSGVRATPRPRRASPTARSTPDADRVAHSPDERALSAIHTARLTKA